MALVSLLERIKVMNILLIGYSNKYLKCNFSDVGKNEKFSYIEA